MNTENLGSNDRSDREGIEHVNESLPRLDVGTSFAFVVESVNCYRGWGRGEEAWV